MWRLEEHLGGLDDAGLDEWEDGLERRERIAGIVRREEALRPASQEEIDIARREDALDRRERLANLADRERSMEDEEREYDLFDWFEEMWI